MQPTFGLLLKQWRERRHLSQLDLGLSANVSTRHISFLETGRSMPSRSMVLGLCDELDIPRAERNQLLAAAGFAPVYLRRSLADPDLVHVRAAVDAMLSGHDPFPAVALDRGWRIAGLNRAATRLFSALGLAEGDSMIDLLLNRDRIEAMLGNAADVARHMVTRLHTESRHLGGDAELDAAAAALARIWLAEPSQPAGPLPPLVPIIVRTPAGPLSLFTLIAQFSSAEDIMLSELKIELMFPADDASRQLLEAFAAGPD